MKPPLVVHKSAPPVFIAFVKNSFPEGSNLQQCLAIDIKRPDCNCICNRLRRRLGSRFNKNWLYGSEDKVGFPPHVATTDLSVLEEDFPELIPYMKFGAKMKVGYNGEFWTGFTCALSQTLGDWCRARDINEKLLLPYKLACSQVVWEHYQHVLSLHGTGELVSSPLLKFPDDSSFNPLHPEYFNSLMLRLSLQLYMFLCRT